MKKIIKKALGNSFSYDDYRELIKNLINKNLSTSKINSETLYHYSTLNDKRMDRLDKKAELNGLIIEKIKKLKTPQNWLVLTEGWCGDAAQNLPLINKMAEISEFINLHLVLRDENKELMNLFLTNGNKSIPKLISLDQDLNILFTWGPRPSTAAKMVQDYKAINGALTPEFKKDLQVWYNKNRGINLMDDFIKLIDC